MIRPWITRSKASEGRAVRLPEAGLGPSIILACLVGACSAGLSAAPTAAAPGSLASTLPTLQTNVGGDVLTEWRYANAVLGAEVWMLDTAPGAQAKDRFLSNQALLDTPLTEGGWPRSLPDDIAVTLSPTYRRKAETPRGEWRSSSYQNLTGLYVVTWKGRTLPDRAGNTRFNVLDIKNDGDPKVGTRILQAGDHRVIALVRHPERGVNVRYEKPDPSDPIRDIKIWTPLYMGAGLDVDLRTYSEYRLGAGKLSAWCTEPASGAPEPLWHPQYLKHLREDPSGVLRLMCFLTINQMDGVVLPDPADWASRKPASYTMGVLVAVSPANWQRHPLKRFIGGSQVSYEWLFDLCRQVGKDAWLQVPHTATADHITGLASLAAASFPSGRRIWFEYSNELWNGYGPYLPQFKAAEAEGKSHGKDQAWGSGRLQAKALRLFEDAWLKAGRNDDELINVLSGFELSADYNARALEGAKALSPGLAECLAITTYFGAGLTRELYALPYGKGNPGQEVYRQAKSIISKDIYQAFEAWRANSELCRKQGIPMVAYEGGSHLLATGFGDWNNPAHAAFMTFLANLHKHQAIADLYQEHWALWAAAGGRTASLYTDIGGYGYFGYWGAKEDVTEGLEASPRYRAAKAFVEQQKGIRPIDDAIGSRPRFSTLPPFRIEAGKPSSLPIPSTGGDGPVTASVLAGGLPPGMAAIPKSDGGMIIQGTPSASGQYRVIIRIADQDGDPDYAVIDLTVDPKGSSDGRLLLFNPADLPIAKLEKSENREEYRSRFDVVASRPLEEDVVNEGARLYFHFDGETPLFAHHYIDQALKVAPSSPFALSGGASLTLLKEEFYAANPSIDGKPRSPALSAKNTTSLLWFGLRDRSLIGRLGSSLELKPDASHPQGQRFGVPTRFDALLLWRRDQMEAPKGAPVSFGMGEDQAALVLESKGSGADRIAWRFVVGEKTREGATRYYLSEAEWTETAAGRFSLTDFNDNPTPGKRWALFQPRAKSFAMPPERELTFAPVDFSEVDAIGIAIQSSRFGWHYDFGISRFLAIGKK